MIAAGLVQGVGFRWFVARRAREMGLAGYVRNLRDGNVEVEAEGEQADVEQLVRDVRRGPRAAHVVDLQLEWMPAAGSSPSSRLEFEIR